MSKTLYCKYTGYRENERPNLQKINLHHNKIKNSFMNTGLLEHGFRIYSLLKIKEDSRSVHVEFPCRTLRV